MSTENKIVMTLKKNIFKIIIAGLLIALCGILAIKKVGVKDGATFTMSVILTMFIFVVAVKNIKKAIYIFIISLPILVTARKLFYVDLYLLKLNFESLIIIYLFIIGYKQVINRFLILINDSRRSKIVIYLISLFVIGSYISVFFSDNIVTSLELTTTSVLIPMLLFIIIVGIFDKSDIQTIVYCLIICINLSCLYGGIQVLGIGLSLSAIKGAREYLSFGYHNVNIFVNVALLVYPLLLNEMLYKKNSKKKKVFLICSFLLQSGAIFITFSRGAWLALGMIVVAIFFSKKYRIVFITMILIGLVLGRSLLPIILNRGGGNQSFLSNTSNTARVLAIYTSKEIIKDNLCGIGYGDFNKAYRENVVSAYKSIDISKRQYITTPTYTLEHPHNFFLSIGVELGVVAVISIILLFIERILRCIKNFSDNRAILISILIFIFIGLTTGIELNHKGVITNMYILWILFGLITVNNSNCKEVKEIKHKRWSI